MATINTNEQVKETGLTVQGLFGNGKFPANVESVADVLSKIGKQLDDREQTKLSQVLHSASVSLTGIANYARTAKLKSLPGDAAQLAKTNPLAFAVGAFGIGIIAGRLAKGARKV